jgi:hypothetical protein
MLKRGVNDSTTIIYVFHVLAMAMLLLLSGCASTVPAAAAPWRILRTIPVSGPQAQPGLWTGGRAAFLALPGDLSKPDINLYDLAADAPPLVLPLASAPRHVTLYPAPGGQLFLLWLDQSALGDTTLMGAFLGKSGGLQRGPAAISNRPVSDYSAAALPSGELLTLWIAAGDRSTPLYTQVIDSAGRPLPPLRLAETARHPSAASAPDGTLHVAWLEPSAPRLWTIRYAAFPGGEPAAVDGTPVGVIKVETDEAVESFAVALDAAQVYCLWSIVQVRGDPRGRLAGLTFPIGDDTSVHPLASAASDGVSLRSPAIPPRVGQKLRIGLTMSVQVDGLWHDIPATVPITRDGIGPIQPVIDKGSGWPVTGNVAFALDDSGNGYAAWSALRDDGTATIFYATDRP